MYQLIKEQHINAPINKVWDFIKSPYNLVHITPPEMEFKVLSEGLPSEIYPGMIIQYRVKPLLSIPTTWVTEITQVKEQSFFIDEQRIGPYKLWHHQHHIEPTKKGTLMKDIVSYQPPFGIIGKGLNHFIIARKLEFIFEYRRKKIEELLEK